MASTPTAWRAVEQVAQADEDGLAALRAAPAAARRRAWQAGAAPAGRWVLDLDATLVTAHSDAKQGAAATYKAASGSTRWAAHLDRGDGRGEPLAIILRPGQRRLQRRR